MLTSASFHPRTTPDGLVVVLATASNLLGLPGWPNVPQIYALTRSQFDGNVISITLVSRHQDTGAPAGSSCSRPSVSDDGLVVAFDTAASLVSENSAPNRVGGPDNNAKFDVYVRDFRVNPSGVTRRISVRRIDIGTPEETIDDPDGSSFYASISGNGNAIAWTSSATDLLPPGTDTNGRNDVYAVTATNGTVNPVRASVDNCDGQSTTAAFSTIGDTVPNTRGVGRVISSVGPRVVFTGAPCDWATTARLAVCPANAGLCPVTNCDTCLPGPFHQVYVRDLAAGTTQLVSRGSQLGALVPGNGHSQRPSISDDGVAIAFESFATNLEKDLTAPDTFEDVFRIGFGDLPLATIGCVLVSLPFTGSRAHIDGNSMSPMISADAEHVAYASAATALVDENGNGLRDDDTNGKVDVFVWSQELLWTRRYSVTSTRAQAVNGDSLNPSLTAFPQNGRVVVYESLATNLDPADANGLRDIFETWSPQGVFIRGDVNKSGCVTSEDRNDLQNFLFGGGPDPPGCEDSEDANDDGRVDLTDVQRLALFIASGCTTNWPPPPFDSATMPLCGNDPTGDGLRCLAEAPQFCGQTCDCQ